MTQEELDNKLVAEYMGWEIIIDPPTSQYPNKQFIKSINKVTGKWDSGRVLFIDSPTYKQDVENHTTEMWEQLCNISYGSAGKYHKSMDWLYPVYQKIIKFKQSKEHDSLDIYSKTLLHMQEMVCVFVLTNGESTERLFKEIVKWIKIYNLKVLEDDKI